MRTANQQRFSGPHTSATIEQIRASVLHGLSYRKAAAILGCSKTHIVGVMQKLGEPQTHRRKGPRYLPPQNRLKWPLEEARALLAGGMTYRAIGRKFGVCGAAIAQGLKRYGYLND